MSNIPELYKKTVCIFDQDLRDHALNYSTVHSSNYIAWCAEVTSRAWWSTLPLREQVIYFNAFPYIFYLKVLEDK